jgi:starch synthase (maltosyl-transferring)
MLIAYSRATLDRSNVIVCIVNLDPRWRQSGWLELPLQNYGIDPDQPYVAHDLLSGARFMWYGPRNYVELDPHRTPVHILRLDTPGAEQPFDRFA